MDVGRALILAIVDAWARQSRRAAGNSFGQASFGQLPHGPASLTKAMVFPTKILSVRTEFPIDVIVFRCSIRTMGIRALTRFNLMMRRVVLRRAIAGICVLALLTIGFAHSIHHFGGPVATVTMHAEVGPSDDAPDDSKKAPVTVEHCHGCSMIAMAVLAPAVVPSYTPADLSARKFDGNRPHTPVTETPPPIASI